MNTNYVRGRSFEYRVLHYLRKLGYYCLRAYASKGLVDVIAVPPVGAQLDRTLMIQCKLNGYVNPKERTKLIDNNKWQGIILIAFSNKHKLCFKNLSGDAISI